jgi:hypothetical protein
MPDTIKVPCTNGSRKDGSSSATCSGAQCYPNSYTYCKELTSAQRNGLIIGGIVSALVALIVSALLSHVPVIGPIGALIINIALLVLIGVVLYAIYNNARAKGKPETFSDPNQVYPLACDAEFYGTSNVYPLACDAEFYGTSNVYPLACDAEFYEGFNLVYPLACPL